MATGLATQREVRVPSLSDSVPNPDPPDPHASGSPGSGSINQRYGSGSFYYHAKIVRKTLIPTVLWPLLDFFSLKNDLKGHGNEADFLEFLQKLGPHRSLTVTFEPFRFWLRIRGDVRNPKTTPRLSGSGSRRLSDSASRGVAMVSRGVAIQIF